MFELISIENYYTAGVCAFYYYFLLHDICKGVSELFAGVIVFLSAFVELVAVSVAAVGMAGRICRTSAKR